MTYWLHSIKTLFLVGIIGMVGLVFFLQTAVEIAQFQSVLEDKVTDALQAKAGEVKDHIDSHFRDVGNHCIDLASTMESMDSYDFSLLLSVIDKMVTANTFVIGSGFWFEPYKYDPAQKYFGPYKYKDTDGQVKLTWEYSNEQYDYFRYDWYRQGFTTDQKVVWSHPYIDVVTGMPMVTATSPVHKSGEVVAVTTVDVGLDELTAYIRDIKIGETGYVFLVSSSGYYLGHRNPAKDLVSNIFYDEDPGLSQLSAKITAAAELSVDRAVIRSAPSFVAYGPVGDTGLRVVLVYPAAEAFASTNRALWTSVAIFVLGLLFISGFLWQVSTRRITRPLAQLMEDAQRISNGDLSMPVTVKTKDEIGFLSRSFEHMRQRLSEKVGELQRSNSELACTYEEITALNEELEANLQEIVVLNQGLECRVEERTAQLTAANQELVATIENLRSTQSILVQSEKMAVLGRLVAGVAHEVNTPLGVGVTAATHLQQILDRLIQLYRTGNLSREDLEEYIAETVESMPILLTNLERASHLVRSFKRVSVDQSNEVRRTFTVKEYLEETLLSLYPKIKGTRITIAVEGDAALEINSFPGSLAQIVTNLVENSLLHAFDKDVAGQICLSFASDGDQFCLIYTDNGKGMLPDTVAHIYEPFFTTKQNSGGTGLGMHIVYNIVSQIFGGKITCQSIVGQGTSFTITFTL